MASGSEYKIVKGSFLTKGHEAAPQGPNRTIPEDQSSLASSLSSMRIQEPQDVCQEEIKKFQAYVDALKQAYLVALGEKLKDLQKARDVRGGGGIRFEDFEVSLSAIIVVPSSESAKGAKYQLKLTSGEDYPAKPPSAVWQEVLVEPKLNIPSTTNSGTTNSQLADSQNDQTKMIEKGRGSKQKASKVKKTSKSRGT